jgi:hypothetical protein
MSLIAGCPEMSDLNECMDTDRCPSCLSTYEIVGLKFHFFRPVSTLMACISCGMVQSEFNGDRNYLPPVQRNRRRGFDQRQQLGLRSLEPDGTNRGVQLALSTRRN